MSDTLLITGCKQLVTLRGPVPRRGRALRELGMIEDGALLVRDGRILAVGTRKAIERRKDARRARKLDLGGRVVLPGFVDSHTHLVFAGNRAEEYERRISGATYERIARAGGGILSTVRKLRAADANALAARASDWLSIFSAHGTTTVEAKSGYGLDAASELKILRVMNALRRHVRLDIVPTFMGAHVVPPEFKKRPDAYVDLLVHRLIPQVAREGLAEFCDVFCDRGAFTVEQARRILTAGRACGLAPRIHAEQLARTGAARLAVELHAASADHLEKVNAADIRALAASDVTCTLLPGCCFHLGLAHYAPARKLIDAGAIVALATDFNPGTSPTLNMQMVLSLACTQMRMTPAESITAATINAAYSLRRADRIGSLEVGKFADLAVFDVSDYREIPYYFGINHCQYTFKRGRAAHRRNALALRH
ncbi:MAG: imidazolonepropionase [Acidobacteria bacterium]|nr:imidazolonepropionase [Acidobacteriota bacterium]MBI3663650.1 imidazolonepropionase [Acidobacteriota bacterium]